jgi:hypothetical protein
MTCKEKSQVLQEPLRTPSEPSQETPLKESEEATEVTAEIESESPGCYGPDSHKWNNKMEVQRLLSGKPDLEIKGTPEATGCIEQPKAPAKKKSST